MRRLIARVRNSTRNLGWVNGLVCVLADGVERFSRGWCRIVRYRLLAQPITPVGRIAAHRGRNLHIREIERDDPLLEQMDRPAATIQARFDQGARCLVALRDDELAGFLWWIEGPYQEDEVRCLFVPQPAGQSAWDFDVYVAPAQRLGPTFVCLWDRAIEYLAAGGVSVSCSRISAFNKSSLNAHRRLGAEIVSSRWYFCCGRMQLSLSRHSPRLHLSLQPESIPTVLVPPKGDRVRRAQT